MTKLTYASIEELAERMGEPKHICGMEAALEDHAFIPFTPEVIKSVQTNNHSLDVTLNYAPLSDYVEQEVDIRGSRERKWSFNEAVPNTVNAIIWTSLENALSGIDGGTGGMFDDGNPTYGIDQCLGFDYMFYFNSLHDRENHGNVNLRVTQNADYQGQVLRKDLIQALEKHWRKAIK